MIRAVVFDVGECLVDETREYGTWADWLGVPRHTFAAMFGAVIAQGRDYRETCSRSSSQASTCTSSARSARGRRTARALRRVGSVRRRPTCLAQLRADGLWLGIAGNQTVRAGGILRQLFTDDVDLIGTSDDWGASKPDPEFFVRVADVVPHEPRARSCTSATASTTTCARRWPPGCTPRSSAAGRGQRSSGTSDEARDLPTFRVGVAPRTARDRSRSSTSERTDRRRPPVQPVVQVAHALLVLVRGQRASHLPHPVHAQWRTRSTASWSRARHA